MYTQVEEASRVTQDKRLVFPLLGNGICQITRAGYYAFGGEGGRQGRSTHDTKCLGNDQTKAVHAVKSVPQLVRWLFYKYATSRGVCSI